HGRNASKEESALFLAASADLLAISLAVLASFHNLSVDHHNRQVKTAITIVARAVRTSGSSRMKLPAPMATDLPSTRNGPSASGCFSSWVWTSLVWCFISYL